MSCWLTKSLRLQSTMKTTESIKTSDGTFEYELVRKDIKNLHISVYPPTGGIRVSAPTAFDKSKIESSLLRKMPWIRKQKKSLEDQPRQTSRRAVSGEDYYLYGKRLQLFVVDGSKRGKIEIRGNKLTLAIDLNSSSEARLRCLDRWYRSLLDEELDILVPKLMAETRISAKSWKSRKMKARWGSCHTLSKKIVINTELIKKSPSCLKYIVIHELVHIIEPSHNAKFVDLMDKHLPTWRSIKRTLNSQPLAYANWDY
jgi:predicted metal-dependent hydrolase